MYCTMPPHTDAIEPKKHAQYNPSSDVPSTIRDNPKIYELVGGGSRLRFLKKLHHACDACEATEALEDAGDSQQLLEPPAPTRPPGPLRHHHVRHTTKHSPQHQL